LLTQKGFTDEEIVALAIIHAVGIIDDPKKKDLGQSVSKLDNYYYK